MPPFSLFRCHSLSPHLCLSFSLPDYPSAAFSLFLSRSHSVALSLAPYLHFSLPLSHPLSPSIMTHHSLPASVHAFEMIKPRAPVWEGCRESRRCPGDTYPIHGLTQPAGAGVGGRQPPIASTSPPSLFITSPIASPFPREPPPRSPPEPSTRPPPPEPIKSSLERATHFS